MQAGRRRWCCLGDNNMPVIGGRADEVGLNLLPALAAHRRILQHVLHSQEKVQSV